MGGHAVQSHLVQVCAGFGGHTFEDLHLLNEELTSGLNLSQVGTILPRRANGREDQAFSPGRVKTCGLGVYAGHLSASDEAMGEILKIYSRFPGLWKKKKNSLVSEARYLEQFTGQLFGSIGLDDIFG